MLGLILVLGLGLALRLPWRNADVGNPGLWTYGYFVTDEGYFTSGGRLHALTGHLFDPDLNEPPTYGAAPAMHFLSALSYRLRGVTYDACRWPSMLAGAAGWTGVFWLASAMTHPLIALGITLPISINPLSLTYERASSSDSIVAAMIVLALCLVCSRKSWAWVGAGLLMALAPAVKATGWALLPLVFLVAASGSRRRWSRIGLTALGFAAGWAALYRIDLWALTRHPSGMAPERLRGVCSAAAGKLPRPRLNEVLRAIPVFPRFPVDTKLGVFLAWSLALPAWSLVSHTLRVWRFRMTRRTALYAGMLLYGAGLAIQGAPVERYFLPLVMLSPLVLIRARTSLWGGDRGSPALRLSLVLATAIAVLALFWLGPVPLRGHSPGDFLSNEYNLPRVHAWRILWPGHLATLGLLTACMRFGRRGTGSVFMAVAAAAIGTLFLWHAFPMARLGGAYSASAHGTFLVQQILLLFSLALIVVPGRHCRWKTWYLSVAIMALLGVAGNHHWRAAIPALASRDDHTRQTARKLIRSLPPNSIVVGNRASSLLRGSPFRLGLCTPNYTAASFVDRLVQLLRDQPQQPLFLMADEDHSYHLVYLQQEGMNRIHARLVGAVPLPAAGGTGQWTRVLILHLTLKAP